jgi:hypothetical protein
MLYGSPGGEWGIVSTFAHNFLLSLRDSGIGFLVSYPFYRIFQPQYLSHSYCIYSISFVLYFVQREKGSKTDRDRAGRQDKRDGDR